MHARIKILIFFTAAALLCLFNSVRSADFFHTEPDDGKAWLIHEIDGAKKSIDLTIYEISDGSILASLSRARARGIDVRVLINHFRDRRHRKLVEEETRSLSSSGIIYELANAKFPFTHEKCMLIDDREAIVMSFNLNPDYFKTTRDFAVITTNSGDLKEIRDAFYSDWGANREFNPGDKLLIWSPETSRIKLTTLIENAKSTLDIYNEELRDRDIISILEDSAAKGVKIRVICPVLKENGGDGNLKGVRALSSSGVAVREIKEGGNRLYIHAKALIADQNTACIGSINFSKYSLDRNRELGIIITDPQIIARLEGIFERDFNMR